MIFDRVAARLCRTVGGKASFEVSGSVAEGARMWVGRSKQPLTFDRGFFVRLLSSLSGLGEIRIGSKFDDPGPDSLGEWIRQDQKISMNPAVYVGGLLIDEGYAVARGRGRMEVLLNRREVGARGGRTEDRGPAREELLRLAGSITDEGQAARALEAVREALADDERNRLMEAAAESSSFIAPTAPRESVERFDPAELGDLA